MRYGLIVATALLFVGAASADPIIFDNGVPTVYNGYSSQLDTAYPFNSQTADDFTLAAGQNVITDAHWWGIWWNPGPPGNATAFKIMIYADNGGMPTGGNPDPSATALKTWTIPVANVGETPYVPVPGTYEYNVDLSADPWTATPGVRYWIAFQSVNTYPPQWGWTNTGATSGTAQQGFPLVGVNYWTPLNTEMAFNLTGVPEPASLLLLGLGALVLRRR
jgi:hypothetical protein